METNSVWLPLIDKNVCTGCGDCIVVCPTDALALADNMTCTELVEVAVVAVPAACNYCGQCEAICPVAAIALPYQVVLEVNEP
jgi:ferredoxin